MRPVIRFALSAALWLAAVSGAAHAADFKSVGPGPAVMYDAPTQKSRKLYVAPVGMPVEIVFANGEWTRVRDAGGDLCWMETRSLSARRTFVVEAAQISARAAANDTAPVVFTAAKGVLLDLAEPISSAWIKVRHRDGETAYVKATDIWGD